MHSTFYLTVWGLVFCMLVDWMILFVYLLNKKEGCTAFDDDWFSYLTRSLAHLSDEQELMEVFICQRKSRIPIGKWDGWFEPLPLLKLSIMAHRDREVWRESIRNEKVWKRFDSISGLVAKQLLLGTMLWKKNTTTQGTPSVKEKANMLCRK